LVKNLKKIIWVFSTELQIPSDLAGCILPANYLKIPKIIIKQDTNINKILDSNKPDVIIFGKCLNSNTINLAKEAKKRNIKTISCFNDWHFKAETTKQEKQFYLNNILAQNTDHIVVKSLEAGITIKKNTGFSFNVIGDCLRYNSFEISTTYIKDPKLLWFGSSSNHDTLLMGLNEIEKLKIVSKIFIVTNISQKLIDKLKSNYYKYIKLSLISFSEINLINVAKASSIIIMPLIEDHIRFVKSSNRILDSLNFGKFVIKSKTTYHTELDEYCYVGNIGEGINWYFDNYDKVIEKIKNGKNFVQNNYSLESIGNQWLKLLNTI
tara:strand:- start:123 stop:1091 length:969 start_codon:yes stop_codon:yes gene_type:complete